MEPIQTVIVDDEEFSIIDIKEHLTSYDIIDIIAEFPDGLSGLEGIHKLKPDLVFVDIEMPGLNGFEMLSRLEYQPAIIFCTGHSHYALEGYSFDPSDFLVKPIHKVRFQKAIEKAIRDIESNNLNQRDLNQKTGLGYILLEYKDLHGDDHKTCIWPDEIIYISPQEDNPNYINYYLKDNEIITVKQTLKKAVEKLDQRFLQTHKSFIVNTSHIKDFFNHTYLTLKNQAEIEIPVSRSYRKAVTTFLRNQSLKN